MGKDGSSGVVTQTSAIKLTMQAVTQEWWHPFPPLLDVLGLRDSFYGGMSTASASFLVVLGVNNLYYSIVTAL